MPEMARARARPVYQVYWGGQPGPPWGTMYIQGVHTARWLSILVDAESCANKAHDHPPSPAGDRSGTTRKMQMLINCTPHSLTIHGHGHGEPVLLAPSGICPRLATDRSAAPDTDGIPTVRTRMGEVTGLPDAVPGTYYVVSGLVLSACPGRADLRSPGEPVRDAEGKIVGCRGLCA